VLAPGETILTAQGPAAGLLRTWKVAQTLVECWSGVATRARAIVDAARAISPDIAVACTRKTAPGTKRFAVAALKAGGAVVHRLGLSETVLVFPEHGAFLGDCTLEETIRRLRRAAPEKKLTIEVTTLDAALVAARAGFDIVQTEKFGFRAGLALAAQLKAMPGRPLLAAAGGITPANAAAYAEAGADILVTSSPYTAPPCDVAVHIAPFRASIRNE
jgi:molybdenum transport protein